MAPPTALLTDDEIGRDLALAKDVGLPWAHDCGSWSQDVVRVSDWRPFASVLSHDDELDRTCCEYIAHAANNYPAALEELRWLRARVRELEDACATSSRENGSKITTRPLRTRKPFANRLAFAARTTDTTAREKLDAARIPEAIKQRALAEATITDTDRRAARRRKTNRGDAGRRGRTK